jgi:hypothetical protein
LLFITCLLFIEAATYRVYHIEEDINNKYTTIGNIALTVTNYGTVGNGFANFPNQPSCQYPIGSGIENMFLSGLWVGGSKNGQISVTTGAIDVSAAGRTEGFEFSNAPAATIIERSSLQTSPVYSANAISHQDFVTEFTDTSLTPGGTPIVGHTPLGIKVLLQTYAYNLNFANNWVILNYKIINIGRGADLSPIDSVYVGLWHDCVVRNTNITPPGGTSFYNKGANGYIDTLSMTYAYDYSGDVGFTDNYAAIKILGMNPRPSGEPVKDRTHYTLWQFKNTNDPIYFSPTDDNGTFTRAGRYQKMMGILNQTDTMTPARIDQARLSANNRIALLSYGPIRNTDGSRFSLRYQQDTMNFVMAVICAKKYGTDPATYDSSYQKINLYASAGWAQRAYDNGYKLPAPPDDPKTKVILSDKKVTLYWAANSEYSVDPISGKKDFEGYKIYRTNPGSELGLSSDLTSQLKLIADFDSTNNRYFNNTGFGYIKMNTPMTFDGDTTKYWYRFEFTNQLNGFQYIYSVTSYDKGDSAQQLGSLESSLLSNTQRIIVGTPANDNEDAEIGVYPNPYYGSAYWDGTGVKAEVLRKIYFYNLPSKCDISIWTLSGDLVDKFTHDAATYNGTDIEWFKTYSNGTQKFAGGEHAWDLISKSEQAIASGLYLFTVKDQVTGKVKKGKFLIVK